MQQHLYEYAVIRFVPKVEREEFLNVGLILFCKRNRYLRVQYQICPRRFTAFQPSVEVGELEETLAHFQAIAAGRKEAGRIGMLDVPERFRWLTAVRSATVQTSRPHPGICNQLDEPFERLFRELVL